MALKDVSHRPDDGAESAEDLYHRKLRPLLELAVSRPGETQMSLDFEEVLLDEAGRNELEAFLRDLNARVLAEPSAHSRRAFIGLVPIGLAEVSVHQRYRLTVTNDEDGVRSCPYSYEVNFEISNPHIGKRFYNLRRELADEHGEGSKIVTQVDELIEAVRAWFYPKDDAEADQKELERKIGKMCLEIGQIAFAIIADFERDYRDNVGWSVTRYGDSEDNVVGRIGEEPDPHIKILEELVRRARATEDPVLMGKIMKAYGFLERSIKGDTEALGPLRDALRDVDLHGE